MKIYTKTGDKGETALFGGERVKKSSLRIETNGYIDELNSSLGLIVAFIEGDESIKSIIMREQKNLLRVGSDIATKTNAPKNLQLLVNRIQLNDVTLLENEIDEWDKKLPKLTTFILPGGNKATAMSHMARAVCRRAEISAVKLSESEPMNELILVYLNRLSDWLFTLARVLDKQN